MTLLLSILGASLLGSVHCAAMCGGFVCLYSGAGPARHTGAAPHAAYNAGRITHEQYGRLRKQFGID